VAGSCQHGNDPSGSVKGEEFLGRVERLHSLEKFVGNVSLKTTP
jgi:hypothetical protein